MAKDTQIPNRRQVMVKCAVLFEDWTGRNLHEIRTGNKRLQVLSCQSATSSHTDCPPAYFHEQEVHRIPCWGDCFINSTFI